jgi:hypothetical protein
MTWPKCRNGWRKDEDRRISGLVGDCFSGHRQPAGLSLMFDLHDWKEHAAGKHYQCLYGAGIPSAWVGPLPYGYSDQWCRENGIDTIIARQRKEELWSQSGLRRPMK